MGFSGANKKCLHFAHVYTLYKVSLKEQRRID